ncbi:hypothetical protein C8J56DRAFT_5435 [Mycena floridula]|nr:hypothetical protein C8J56DRAFT_5435 [Mycena floridula]
MRHYLLPPGLGNTALSIPRRTRTVAAFVGWPALDNAGSWSTMCHSSLGEPLTRVSGDLSLQARRTDRLFLLNACKHFRRADYDEQKQDLAIKTEPNCLLSSNVIVNHRDSVIIPQYLSRVHLAACRVALFSNFFQSPNGYTEIPLAPAPLIEPAIPQY